MVLRWCVLIQVNEMAEKLAPVQKSLQGMNRVVSAVDSIIQNRSFACVLRALLAFANWSNFLQPGEWGGAGCGAWLWCWLWCLAVVPGCGAWLWCLAVVLAVVPGCGAWVLCLAVPWAAVMAVPGVAVVDCSAAVAPRVHH